MLAIQLDLNYLERYLNISAQRLQAYGAMSLREIMEAEAEKGNIAAQEYLIKILKDPNALLKLFKLGNANNRWQILREMTEEDLQYLLQFLESKDLVMGLQFFTQDALMKFIREMPKKEITKILFECYSKEKFLELVPNKELDKWFESDKVDKKKVFEHIQGFNQEVLAKMVEAITGQNQEESSRKDLLGILENLKPNQFLEAVQSLSPKFKRGIIMSMTEEDPKLWQEFSIDALTKPIELLDKPEVIKGMAKLEDDTLIKVLDNLPKDLLAVVVTQIDPEVFADVLSKNYQEILKNVVSL